MTDRDQTPVYWFARTDEEGAGPTYVVGRGDEEITYPCLFRHEAEAIVGALRDRLAQPEQEPFGYFQLDLRLDAWVQNRVNNKGVAFYTTPPRREWVGLTDEEKAELDAEYGDDTLAHLDAIEAKLKEKNGT